MNLSTATCSRTGGAEIDMGREELFELTPDPRYREAMAEASRIDFDDPAPIDQEEDEETLAAIDEGIRDDEAGRTVPIEEVRALLPQTTTKPLPVSARPCLIMSICLAGSLAWG